MDNKNTTKKLHNPQSTNISAYIPNWLSQIPISELSIGAKLVYARLSKWAGKDGKAFRSAPQLSLELGMSSRQIERYIQELKHSELIGTFHPQAGGVNHFEFYDHNFMFREINDNLIYSCHPPTPTEKPIYPPTDVSAPPDRCVGTPPTDVSVIKDNKGILNTTTTHDQNLCNDFPSISGPVVVINSSLTSTPSSTPVSKHIEALIKIYNSKPFVTNDILCEEDFIDAGLWAIENRGEIRIEGKLKGISILVLAGTYEGEDDWISKRHTERRRKEGQRKNDLVEKAAEERAIKELRITNGPKTDTKSALRNLMLDMEIKKAELTKQPSYAERNNKPIKFPTLPPQNDYVITNFMYEEENTKILEDEKEAVCE